MNRMRPARALLSCILVSCLHSVTVHAEAPTATPASSPPNVPRDGQHDFDFNLGTWKTHIRRLLHPLSGSDEWVGLDGTVTVRKVWGGHAQLEEIEADGSTGHFEGLTLFLYNPEAHQWGQYFANSAAGILNPPVIGEFNNGRGEFFDRMRLVRQIMILTIEYGWSVGSGPDDMPYPNCADDFWILSVTPERPI